jgi:hypothetical protein
MRSVLIVIAFAASPALASATYPGEIQTKYGLANIPSQLCTLCHPGATGTGTATTRFAVALQARGLVGSSPASLNMALDRLATDMVDSDGDGVTDVAELMAGTNPNVAEASGMDGGTGGGGGGGSLVVPDLKYGCGADVTPGLLLLGALIPLLRRRR